MLPGSAQSQAVCSTRVRLSETLRIGSLDGIDALTRFHSVAVAPSGRIYLPQQKRGEVLVFSPDGELLDAFGRFGSGPGDFDGGPRAVRWVGSELWVSDRLRAQSFDGDHRPVDFVQFDFFDPGEGVILRPEFVLAGGSVWPQQWVTPTSGAAPWSVAVRHFGRDGVVTDTIAVLSTEGDRVTTGERGGFARHPLTTLMPGSANGHIADLVMPDLASIVLTGPASETSFPLLHLSLAGDTLSRASVPFSPIPVSRSDRQWWTEEFGAVAAGDYSAGHPDFLDRPREARERARARAEDVLRMPDTYPPVRRVLAGTDGTVWLLREFEPRRAEHRWEVYDTRGTMLAEFVDDSGADPLVPWLPRLFVLRASLSEVWGTTTDEFGVPYLHRFAVLGGCG